MRHKKTTMVTEEDLYLKGFYIGNLTFRVRMALHDDEIDLLSISVIGEKTPTMMDRQAAILCGKNPDELQIEEKIFPLSVEWEQAAREQFLRDTCFMERARDKFRNDCDVEFPDTDAQNSADYLNSVL